MTDPRVLVIGSLHCDLIARADTFPPPGASVIGNSFSLEPGGKAANQAAQLARLGVPTMLVSRVGADQFGDAIRSVVGTAGVDTRLVSVDSSLPTGASTVFAARGDYTSIIVPGAAAHFGDDEVARACLAAGTVQFVIGQLEIPSSFTESVFRSARDAGVRTLLNASPIELSSLDSTRSLLSLSDIVVVNRVEAATLLETSVDVLDDLAAAAEKVRRSTRAQMVVVTGGSEGAGVASPSSVAFAPAIPSTVIDTVGAGDAFLGALVAGLLDGRTESIALREAVAAGALAVRSSGAFPSLPDRSAIDQLLGT